MSNRYVDHDYTSTAVPESVRRSTVTMFMIMMGFTFFSASMWTGQQMAKGLDFNGFVQSLLLGGIILSIYTGALGYIGAKTGMGLDMLAQRSFGIRGSWVPSLMIVITQTGWFGVGLAMFAIPVAKQLLGSSDMAIYGLVLLAGILMTSSAYFGINSLTVISYIAVPCVALLGGYATYLAIAQGDKSLIDQFAASGETLTVAGGVGMVVGSFVSGGTTTPNFTRFAKNGFSGLWITVAAFFFGNSLMFFFGATASVFVGGAANDIFDVMIKLGLFWSATLVLGLNIWTTNDNALYSVGMGLSNITGLSKRSMVLFSGTLGTIFAVWMYNNFCPFLSMLNATLPPVGAIIVCGYFCNRSDYRQHSICFACSDIEWGAVIGVLAGAVAASLIPFGFASVNGMVVAAACYLAGRML